MTLLGIALCSVSLLLLLHSISRQSVIRALARELRSLREREQELRIRFDDLNSKVNNTLVQITKQTGMFDKRVGNIEDRLTKGISPEKVFQLESEADQEMRERLARLEEIALQPATPPLALEEKGAAPQKSPEPSQRERKITSVLPSVLPLSAALKRHRDALNKDLQVFCSISAPSAKSLCDSIRKAFRDHRLDSLIDDDLVEQVAETLKSRGADKTSSPLERELLAGLLQQALRDRLRPAKTFDWKKDEGDRRLRMMLLVGASGSGKTTASVGVARSLQSIGARVLLADCAGASSEKGGALADRHRETDLAIVAPLINAKPHHVAYKAIHRAQDEHFDIVLLDTPTAFSGRKKVSPEVTAIAAMIAREHPYPPHDTVMVLSASDPKEATEQGKKLLDEGSFSGLILSHLDTLPYPGAVLEIVSALQVPLWYVGYGVSGREVCPFEAIQFSSGLFGVGELQALASKQEPRESERVPAP